MTPEELQDALTLLPQDMVMETERQRFRRPVPWKKYLSLAAMFAVILGCSLLLRFGMGSGKSASAPQAANDSRMESMEEAPACMEVADPGIAMTDFSLSLLRGSRKPGENTLLSPLSVLNALALTAEGAEGETLAQLEAVFGMSLPQLREYLPQWESGSLQNANALWLKDEGSLTLSPEYRDICRRFYGGDIFSASFDGDTVNRINSWVNDATHGQIPRMLESLDPESVMVLVNALCFEGQWAEPYTAADVWEGTFTTEIGQFQPVSMMYSTESRYLEDAGAVGFVKEYAGGKFAFAALLPKEGVTVEEYLESLTASHLLSLLTAPQEAVVKAGLPKFRLNFDTELSELLKAMGAAHAFDPNLADFSAMGQGENNLFISQVLHKTAITVAEEGTTAAASTVVEMVMGALYQPDVKFVTLDRPFLYLLIDRETGVPFFLGTLETVTDAALFSAPASQALPILLLTAGADTREISPARYQWIMDGCMEIQLCPDPEDRMDGDPIFHPAPLQACWETPPDSVTVRFYRDGAYTDPAPFFDGIQPPEGSSHCLLRAVWEDMGEAEYLLTFAAP